MLASRPSTAQHEDAGQLPANASRRFAIGRCSYNSTTVAYEVAVVEYRELMLRDDPLLDRHHQRPRAEHGAASGAGERRV